MTSTSVDQSVPLHRIKTADSALTSKNASPFDSPNRSPSSTSLSSMDSDLALNTKTGTMIDTYGNEFEIPDFTIKQIRDAIPAHCLERSGARGLAYVARDLFYLTTVFALFYNFCRPEYVPNSLLRGALWAAYTMLQGMIATGVWVLAHECGHQSFSPSKVVNDSVGFVLHSSLLVPYFSWKISHGKHHKGTGNVAKDMVFVPKTRAEYASRTGRLAHELHELCEETPLFTAGHLVGQQLLGWILYITMNVTGHNKHEVQKEGRGRGKQNGFMGGVNHFNPASPLYEAKDGKLILASDIGLATMGLVLYALTQRFGLANMVVWYFIPYLWVNHWLGKYPHRQPSHLDKN